MTDSEILLEFTEKALNLAQRWAKVALSEYYYVSSVRIIMPTKHIEFYAYPSTSGIGQTFVISVEYMDDDTNLERDALAWKKQDEEKRAAQITRLNELSNHPIVLEYKKLSNPFPHLNNQTTLIL